MTGLSYRHVVASAAVLASVAFLGTAHADADRAEPGAIVTKATEAVNAFRASRVPAEIPLETLNAANYGRKATSEDIIEANGVSNQEADGLRAALADLARQSTTPPAPVN